MFAKGFLAALSVAVAFVGAGVAAPLKVEKRVIKVEKPTFTVDITYPRTGRAVIDGPIEAWVKGVEREFLAQTQEMGGTPGPWDVNVGYEVARNDEAMFAVHFTQAGYTGGAHGYAVTRTFTFLQPDGIDVELPELFTTAGVKRISDISIAQMSKELLQPGGMSDADWVKRGAGPNARNFRSFVLKPSELVVFFDAYQVAAYAAGPQEAHIPFAHIKTALRADPRAPAASFDCAVARSDVERAICSSRDLARLDRHVAEAYAEKLSWAADGAARRTIQQGQREWLKRRDGVCLRAGQPLVACLSDSYQRRLQALDDPGE
jgi:uncharacterized protein YecT (DUF1311 family)